MIKLKQYARLFLALLPLAVLSQPYEGFPFNEQLPTVARVGEEYSFQISNETYLSSVGDVAYSADGLPDWLSFDSGSRTFTGTPSSSDATTNLSFYLIGTDSDSSLNKSQTLVVSTNSGPQLSDEYTVLSQLANVGQTDGVDGLVLSSGSVFNITFDSKTFSSDDTIVTYYGRSSDRTSLPNWLFFDSANLRFSGVAPAVNSEIAPSFSYGFIFVASDYSGYLGNSVEFSIVIGAHELSTTLKDVININGTAGDVLDYEIPLESVFLDTKEISTSNISSIQLNGAPDWLSISDYALVGTIPDDYTASNTTFNVTIYDSYENSVSLFFEIESIDSLFAVDSFRSANATRGSYFQYYFLSTDFTDYSSTNISVEFDSDGSDWLTFHSSNLTINGETPDDFDSSDITVIASKSKTEDELSFKIYGIDPISSSSSASSSSSHHSSSTSSSHSSSSTSEATSTSSTSATSSAVATPVSKSSGTNHKALAIGLGVAIPVFALIVVAILLFLCCARKRKQKSDQEENDESASPKISKPILGNPANGPNRSPNGYSTPSTASPEKNNDWSEPQRLGALNALKLDEKDFYDGGSTSSSTNVGSFNSIHDDTRSSLYQDALQAQSTDYLMNNNTVKDISPNKHDSIPKRSWRQTIDSNINRDSLNSLATVSTNELLSIRLADDGDIRKDPRKSSLGFRDSVFLGSTASSILTKDDSGNIQKLDSDGNIVELNDVPRQRVSRGTDLDILKEENTPRPPHLGFDHDHSFSTTGSSMGADFYQVNTANGGVEWLPKEKTQFTFESDQSRESITPEKNTRARLMTFTNKGRADESNDLTQSTGEAAEIESL